MKKIIKCLGIIALIAVIGFTMAGCDQPTDPDDGGSDLDKVATPVASPAAGAVASGQTITLTTTTAGASIRYTTNGSSPSSTSGTVYDSSNKPTISTATTIKAIAYKSGMDDSDILTAAYTVNANMVAQPTASPAAGAVASGTSITLTTTTAGASIRYTTNGSNPSSTSGTEYTAPITITAATTIKAIAYKTDMIDSGILTASYTISGGAINPTPIQGNLGNYRFGIGAQGETVVTQAVWELSEGNVTIAKHSSAKLVLVLSQAPSATTQLVWQGPANNLWWNEAEILGGTGNVTDGNKVSWNAGANTLTINLASALNNYSSFSAQSALNLIIAYYGGSSVNDLGIVSANLVADDGGAPTVLSVSVTPNAVNVAKGGTQSFNATVVGTNNPAQTVTWSIDQGNKNAGTTINSGLLTVAAEETLTTLTVRATSTVDNNKSGTATVTVTGGGSGGYVWKVVVDPESSVNLKPGQTKQFTAEVLGTSGGTATTVTWTIGVLTDDGLPVSTGQTSTAGGSTISSTGLFTLGSNEFDDKWLYVVATSTADTSKRAFGQIRNLGYRSLSIDNVGAVARRGSSRFWAMYEFVDEQGNDQVDRDYDSFTWSIEDAGKAAGTHIINTGNDPNPGDLNTGAGNLVIAENERLLNITVKATLKSNTSISATSTIRVVSVDRVIASPANAGVARGGQITVNATVVGDNNPPQGVTWDFASYNNPTDPGTVFDPATGVLTIGANEKLKCIKVEAAANIVAGNIIETGFARIYPYNPSSGTGYIIEIDDADYNGTTQTVTLDNLQYNEVFLAKVNPTSGSLASGGISTHSISPSASLRRAQRSNVQTNRPSYVSGHPAVTAFNANPPAISAGLRAKMKTPRPVISLSGSVIGQKKNFWVGFNGNDYTQKEATLLAAGTHSNIWVVGDPFGADVAQSYADKFDLIYPAVTNVFGYEYGAEQGQTTGGRDGDTKIQILFCPMPAGTNIAGFFNSVDFYDQATLDSAYGSGMYKTNEAEIFYMSDTMGWNSPMDTWDTLSHELQHMINFNQKFVIKGNGVAGTASETWYNEMLSMVAQDLVASILGFDVSVRAAVYDYMGYFFGGLASSTNRLDSWGGNYGDYGNKYAFGAYLLRNYGGAPLIKSMMGNNTTGIASVNAALQAVASVTFEQAFSSYGEAVIYSARNIPQGANTYDKGFTSTVGGISYNVQAFNPWGFNNETNFYSNTNSTLNPYSVQIEVPQALRGQEIQGSVNVTVTKPANGVKLYLLVR